MHSNAMNGRLLVFFQVTVKANFQEDLRKKSQMVTLEAIADRTKLAVVI